MRLSGVPNLRVEDFPADQQSWLSRLFIQLNPFFQSLNQVMSQNLDFSTNIMAVTKDYDQTITTFQPFSFQWTFTNVKPNDLRCIKALKDSTPTLLLAAWKFDSSTKAITVTDMREVSGTQVSALSGHYQFTIRAMI